MITETCLHYGLVKSFVNKRKSTVSFEINELVDVVNSELLKEEFVLRTLETFAKSDYLFLLFC